MCVYVLIVWNTELLNTLLVFQKNILFMKHIMMGLNIFETKEVLLIMSLHLNHILSTRMSVQ